MIKNYKLQMNIMGVPAYAIVNDISYPSHLETDDGEKFWTSHTIWCGFHNKKLYEYDMGKTTQKQWEKRRKVIEKQVKHNSMQVKDEYQLPFSETGYRSSIFDVGHKEKITKDKLKKWIVKQAHNELGLEEGENPWKHAGIKSPVEIIKEVKFAKHDKD